MDAISVGQGITGSGGRGDDNRKPLIPNESADAIRFEIPAQPTYPAGTSLLSILSLVFMSGLSVYLYMQLASQDVATWVLLPFIFTIFGGTLGWVFELGLLLGGTPFQKNRNRLTVFIQKIRFLNLAPVATTLFFFVCAIMIPDSNLVLAILFLMGATCFGLGVALYFGGAPSAPLVLLGMQIAQFLIVLAYAPPAGGYTVAYFLMGQAVLQLVALVIGTETPLKSTGFHIFSTIGGYFAFAAIATVLRDSPGFSQQVAPVIPAGSLLMWSFIIVCILGLVFTLKANPMTYNNLRAAASLAVWGPQYFLLISAKRFPKPLNLSEVYKDGTPPVSKLKPYYQQHPEFLPEVLNIPAVERLEGNVTAFGDQVKKVKKVFKIIALMDHFFPQANVKIPLKEKPRMNIWSNGFDIYPQIFLWKIFGYTLPIPEIKPTPKPALEAYKEGQLLAYLGEYGIANPFLKPAPDKEKGTLVMDFRFLEKYETKPDYESYGGQAFFRVNSEEKKLELISVVAPHSDEEIAANPMDSTFRHAESMVLASMYFQVISGKHLAEIHMTYNLLEVVFHNAFDAQGQFNHPFRTFMYLHLFSHELAEELTTEHLVQEGAVFTQIFATTHSSLINHLNDSYHSFDYGEDEDFDARLDAMRMENGEVLPNACINWEMEYVAIWRRYTDALIDIIYEDDAAVQNDKYLQDVYRGMNQVIFKGLPDRYDQFQTKKGVSRWATDTIHHLVVRHQVYGTTGINAAMDPRISSSQIPKDRGTPGVDEWRSLMCVGLATACARFTLLVGEGGETFVYLLDGVDEKYKDAMAEVFVQLQEDMVALDHKWRADNIQKEFNYNYFRAAPSDLRTGPGY